MLKITILTICVMIAFAGNSILCRLALSDQTIDAASFTTLRILSGALVLWLLSSRNRSPRIVSGDWFSATALFVYAASFSFAYLGLQTGLGALLLFCSVQVTMIVYGLLNGECFTKRQLFYFVLAISGLFGLLLPGMTAPPLNFALLMIISGVAWGTYSLRGRVTSLPLQSTAGNFARASVLAMIFSVLTVSDLAVDLEGIVYAMLSGGIASGIGYTVWYGVLPYLKATTAGIVQLSVPVIAAVGGYILLDEMITMRMIISSLMILGGILGVLSTKHQRLNRTT
ncbi:MAG: EamA family transporter [Deltaproteobacteria bacterium]|jgi:drug/metabolite transporter (DMT)-like permease|nr:EamA family transporter [Deltaproteobacteria bacterium]